MAVELIDTGDAGDRIQVLGDGEKFLVVARTGGHPPWSVLRRFATTERDSAAEFLADERRRESQARERGHANVEMTKVGDLERRFLDPYTEAGWTEPRPVRIVEEPGGSLPRWPR